MLPGTPKETLFQGRIEKGSAMNGIADVLIWRKCMLYTIRKRAVHKATIERYKTAFTS